MAYNIQEQVNSLEDQGIGALTQQLQHNPKLVVGIALENLQKDMQEAERAKQIGGGDTGLPIIDKKLASLSGGPSGQRDAMATASPGLQQRGQQLQGQQLLKSLFQAAKTPGGMPAAMTQARGGAGAMPGGMPTQRMAMGGIVGYQDGGNVQPIPALMDKYGSEMVMEFLEGEKQLRAEAQHVAPQYADAFQQKRDNFYSGFDQGFVSDLLTARSGQSYPKFSSTDELMKYVTRDRPGLRFTGPKPNPEEMAHGGVVGYANRGLVSGEDVDTERLLDAIRQVESGGNPNADSGYAYGAYQIGPEAGAQPGYGVEPIDVYNSTEEEQRNYARDYLEAMLGEFGGDLEPALQAYNVGPNALNQIRAGERDMPAETSDYYSKVMKEYGDRTMPQDEDFVPLSSMADSQGMMGRAVEWAKENPLEAASIGLMFIPGVGWGMAGARGAAMGARALAPRGIAAAKQIGSGIREGARNLFTRPRMSGPGSAVRNPYTGRMVSADAASGEGAFYGGRLTDLPGVSLNRAFSPQRTANVAGGVGAGTLLGTNLPSGEDIGNALTPGGPGNNVSPGLAAAERRRTLRENPAIGSLRAVGRQQEEAVRGPIEYLQGMGRQQQEAKEAGASRAGRYMGMGANTQDMIRRADPAARLAGVDTNREFEAPETGIMSQVPERFRPLARHLQNKEADRPFRRDRDRFAEAIGPEAVEAIQQNQQRRAEAPEEPQGYAPGISGDAREIRDYLQRILGFKAGGRVGFEPGGTVEGEGVIPVNEGSDGMLKKAWGWAKENPALAASVGITLVAGGIMLGAPAGLAALGSLGMAGARALPAVARAAPQFLRGARTVAPAGGRLGRFGQSLVTKPRTSGLGSAVRGPKGMLSAEAAKKAGLPAMRAFSPSRPATLGGAGTTLGLGLSGGSEDADAVQVQRDTSNLDRNRPFDTEAFSEAFPDVAEEMRQRPLDETQRSYDEQRAALEKRRREEARPGIMSQVGSALGSPQAQRFYSAMQDLGYAGGAPRGQEGTQMIRGLAARDAQNRELQALEDKVALEGRTLDVAERTSINALMAALWGNPSFQEELTRLANEMDLPSSDPKVREAAIASFLGMLNLEGLSTSGPVGNMPGLDTTTRNELEAYTATP